MAIKQDKKQCFGLTELCWHVDVELKIIELPQGDDPASFLQKSKNLEELIAKAKDIFVFYLEDYAKGFLQKGLQEKVSTIRNLLSTICSLQDSLKQELLLARAAKTFDIPFDSLKQELFRVSKKEIKIATKEQRELAENSQDPLANQAWKEIALLEKKLFSVIINNMQLMKPDYEQYCLHILVCPCENY